MSAVDALARALIARSPAVAARTLERFDAVAVAEVLGELDPELAAEVVRALSMAAARAVLQHTSPDVGAGIAAQLASPRAAALLRGLDSDRRAALLDALPAAQRTALARVLAHRPRTAGALMEAAEALAGEASAADALEHVRRLGDRAGAAVPVIDPDGRLLGLAPIAALVAAPAAARLADLARRPVQPLYEEDDAIAVAAHPAWRSADALPVVTRAGLLAGMIRYPTVQELLGEAAPAAGPVTLPVALAELFWIGLAGITDGLGRVVADRSKGEP